MMVALLPHSVVREWLAFSCSLHCVLKPILFTSLTGVGPTESLVCVHRWPQGSLVPRPSPPPVFDCLQYTSTEGELLVPGLQRLDEHSLGTASHVSTYHM